MRLMRGSIKNIGVPSHTAAVWPIRILATRRIIKRVRQYLK